MECSIQRWAGWGSAARRGGRGWGTAACRGVCVCAACRGGGASAVALGVGFLTLHAKLEVPLINSVSRLAQPEVLDWVAVQLVREV